AEALEAPGVRFWTAWLGGELGGCGALKRLDAQRAEIKSMRVADRYLGRGIGRAMLVHLLDKARTSGHSSVWLETGSAPEFVPAQRLYESAGFTRCGPFGEYRDDAFSV